MTTAAVSAPVNRFEHLPAEELDRRMREASAHIHAATCELAELTAAVERAGLWNDTTLRSFPHYLSIVAGFGLHTGKTLTRVGEALERMPAIRAAFASGELSFDKVAMITEVASPEDEKHWADVARAMTPGRLARFCRKCKQAVAAQEPGHAERLMAARGVWAHYADDGLLHLLAKLPPDDGALVMATLEELARKRPLPDQTETSVGDPARMYGDAYRARQADALVAVFEHAQQPAELSPPLTRARVVVHVDEAVLAGRTSGGRCEIENGPPIDAGTAVRLAAEADIVTVIERNGSPLDVREAQRRFEGRQRMAMEERDKRCRVPGCSQPAHRCEGHHLDGFALGGKTRLDRGLLICKFHHVRLEQGAFRIVEQPDGRIDFVTRRGRLMKASDPTPVDPVSGGLDHLRWEHEEAGIAIGMFTPLATEAHLPYDCDLMVDTFVERRFGRPPTPPTPPRRDDIEETADHEASVRAVCQPDRPPRREPPPAPPPRPPCPLSQDELAARILELVATGRPGIWPDHVVAHTGCGISDVMVCLGRMEVDGDIRRTPAGYVIVSQRSLVL